MIVYEFWLREEFWANDFRVFSNGFYNIGLGTLFNRWDDPHNVDGEPCWGTCVYTISRNPFTHWVQLLVDDNTQAQFITAIEARINGLKDDEPFRKYDDDKHDEAPPETPKHFTLERVLRVRQKQKDGTLGRIEDVQ